MDVGYIKGLLEEKPDKKDNRLIKRGEVIPYSLFILLCKVSKNTATKAFYDTTFDMKTPYIVELKCSRCGEFDTRSYSLTDLKKIISAKKANGNLVCRKCYEKEKQEEKKKKAIQDQINKPQNTQKFIGIYFSPKEKVDTEKFWKIFKHETDVDTNEIITVVSKLPYKAFLGSAYWECIRKYKLQKAHYRCEICGCNSGGLNVHHITYNTHGKEHIKEVADNDLIVLCENCHKKVHNIQIEEV